MRQQCKTSRRDQEAKDLVYFVPALREGPELYREEAQQTNDESTLLFLFSFRDEQTNVSSCSFILEGCGDMK